MTPAIPAIPIHFQMLRMDKVCLSCAGEREYGIADAGAGRNPYRGYLAVSWRFGARPRDPDHDQQPGEPRRHDGRDRRSAAVDLARRTWRQADRHVDGQRPPRGTAQRRRARPSSGGSTITASAAGCVSSPRMPPASRRTRAAGDRPDGRHTVSHRPRGSRPLVSWPRPHRQRLDPRNPRRGQQGS